MNAQGKAVLSGHICELSLISAGVLGRVQGGKQSNHRRSPPPPTAYEPSAAGGEYTYSHASHSVHRKKYGTRCSRASSAN